MILYRFFELSSILCYNVKNIIFMSFEKSEISIETLPENHLVMQLIHEREDLRYILKGGTIEVEQAKQGDGVNVVQIYTIGDKKYVHKESELPQNIVSERIGTSLCRQAGINAPVVQFSDETGMLETFVDGVPLNSETLDQEEVRAGCHDLGKVFKKLHSVKADGFGLFRSKNQNEYNTLAEYYSRLKERNLSRAIKSDLFSEDQTQKIARIFDGYIESSSDQQPVLTHQDIGLQNVHVQNGRVTGLIDFADCQGSIPVADFARLYVQQRLQPEKPPYFDWVTESYGEVNFEGLKPFVIVILIKYILSNPLKIDVNKMKQVLDEILEN